MFVCTEGEDLEQCDATASPNDETPYENGDANVDPNFSLSVDSHSDSSDSNSSSLHEVNVCALNETQNLDLTAREKKSCRKQKKKRTIQLEWKRIESKFIRNTGHTYRNFEKVTEVPERMIVPFWGNLQKKYFLKFSDQEKLDISIDIGLWAISVTTETILH